MKNIWPEMLMIRDTQLYDDLGGGGQRIYTTAGRGYEKRRYVREDVLWADLAATHSADYIAGYNKGREDAAKITDKYRDDFVNSHSKMIRALLHLGADGGQKND